MSALGGFVEGCRRPLEDLYQAGRVFDNHYQHVADKVEAKAKTYRDLEDEEQDLAVLAENMKVLVDHLPSVDTAHVRLPPQQEAVTGRDQPATEVTNPWDDMTALEDPAFPDRGFKAPADYGTRFPSQRWGDQAQRWGGSGGSWGESWSGRGADWQQAASHQGSTGTGASGASGSWWESASGQGGQGGGGGHEGGCGQGDGWGASGWGNDAWNQPESWAERPAWGAAGGPGWRQGGAPDWKRSWENASSNAWAGAGRSWRQQECLQGPSSMQHQGSGGVDSNYWDTDTGTAWQPS